MFLIFNGIEAELDKSIGWTANQRPLRVSASLQQSLGRQHALRTYVTTR